MSVATATRRRFKHSIEVEATATATAYLDDFDPEAIMDWLRENKPTLLAQLDIGAADIEDLYYATRGEGPIVGRAAEDVRAFLRLAAGRA